jgi:type IV secretory pathway VirB4 component
MAERLGSYCDGGSHAFLLDRSTNVPEDAPLLVFDTRKVPSELSGAVLFAIAEHVSAKLETGARGYVPPAGDGRYLGRSMLVIDEAWKLVARRATGEWVNDLARRARHLGLFLIAISQQLSDFSGDHGRALIRNSTMQLFLRQAPDELRYVEDALRLSPAEIRAIGRLKTVKRAYSQAYWVNGTRGRGTIALRVGPAEYWAATSDPIDDVPRRDEALRATGGDPWAALAQLADQADA